MVFKGLLIVVNDINVSREFYEHVLKQKVKYDFGENIEFEGGFSIHLKSHFAGLIGAEESSVGRKSLNAELYFEEDDLEGFINRIENCGIDFLHPLKEQPWGQRVARFYDPDFHIIEVGESMKNVVRRYIKRGLTAKETAAKTSMPIEFVRSCMEQC